MNHQIELMKLAIGWSFVAALIITLFLTLGSLVGWVKFAVAKQQAKLFSVLIVEIGAIGLGIFKGMINISPEETGKKVVAPYQQKVEQLDHDVKAKDKVVSEKEAEVAELKTGQDELLATLSEANKTIEDKTGRLASIEKMLGSSDNSEVAAKLRESDDELKRSRMELAEAQAVNDSFRTKIQDLESKVAAARRIPLREPKGSAPNK
jgi:hypothetical protein